MWKIQLAHQVLAMPQQGVGTTDLAQQCTDVPQSSPKWPPVSTGRLQQETKDLTSTIKDSEFHFLLFRIKFHDVSTLITTWALCTLRTTRAPISALSLLLTWTSNPLCEKADSTQLHSCDNMWPSVSFQTTDLQQDVGGCDAGKWWGPHHHRVHRFLWTREPPVSSCHRFHNKSTVW